MTDRAWRQMIDEPLADQWNEIQQLERRVLAETDPAVKRRLLRELAELTAKETRV